MCKRVLSELNSGSGDKLTLMDVEGVNGINNLKLQIASDKETVCRDALASIEDFHRKDDVEKMIFMQNAVGTFEKDALLNRINALKDIVWIDIVIRIVKKFFFELVVLIMFTLVVTKKNQPKKKFKRTAKMVEPLSKSRIKIMEQSPPLRFKPKSG